MRMRVTLVCQAESSECMFASLCLRNVKGSTATPIFSGACIALSGEGTLWATPLRTWHAGISLRSQCVHALCWQHCFCTRLLPGDAHRFDIEKLRTNCSAKHVCMLSDNRSVLHANIQLRACELLCCHAPYSILCKCAHAHARARARTCAGAHLRKHWCFLQPLGQTVV